MGRAYSRTLASRAFWRARVLLRDPSHANRGRKAVVLVARYESGDKLRKVARRMVDLMRSDARVLSATQGLRLTVGFAITDLDETFLLTFRDGEIGGEVGADITSAQIRLAMDAETLDGVFAGEVDPMGAAMSGQIMFSGDLGLAMSLLGVVDDLREIYKAARDQAEAE